MSVRIEIAPRSSMADTRGAQVLANARSLGILGVDSVEVRDLYFLDGLTLSDRGPIDQVIAQVLLDPVIQSAEIMACETCGTKAPDQTSIEVAPRPGTTDSVAESLMFAIESLLRLKQVKAAATGTRYLIGGDVSPSDLSRLAHAALANDVVQTWQIDQPIAPPFIDALQADHTVERVRLRGLDDAGLLALSAERRLALDLVEMRAIQAIFEREGRDPTDVEIEMFAQTWSEHCVHKTFKARITLTEDGVVSVIDGLFKTYIAAATERTRTDWLESVFVDNAGIVGFEDGWSVAFKAETHNHPSALEPFGGANTGVGGVIRDVLGVSARPIACTDVLCFGPPDLPNESVPEGVLHPRRIAAGVVAGVGDYGNKMGIPTVNGAVLYHPGYTANPLVYCGCVGVLPTGSHRTGAQAGDLVVSIGGRTGRDGLRGATFSSMEMDTSTQDIAGTSVQIGHPIHEKQVMEALLEARDQGLYHAVTDCGAGGLSSAVGEMAEVVGARIHLERVPLKYAGLKPWEVWLSEAQERMVFAIPPRHWDAFKRICERHSVEATDLGTFTGDGRILISSGEAVVADLSMAVLHDGIPQRELVAHWQSPALKEPELPAFDAGQALLRLLATPDIRSKEDIVRSYDHEVQGGTIVKPFVGPGADGPSDAAVLRPLDVVKATGRAGGRGVALSVGIRPSYAAIDPYAMALAVVDEAVRNAVAVGADPGQIALLDNFCWGNPNLPDRLGGLVRCVRGCFDAAVAWKAPFISGKDSLNNEYMGADGVKHAIPGTLLISALAIVDDIDKTVTMDLKTPGNTLFVVGVTADELGASSLYELFGEVGAHVPVPHGDYVGLAHRLHQAITLGLVRSAHDLSEGGLAVTLAEMVLAGQLGAEVSLDALAFEGGARTDTALLFAESLTRWVVEVTPQDQAAFEAMFEGFPCAAVGQVRAQPELRITGLEGSQVLHVGLAALREAFRGHLQAV